MSATVNRAACPRCGATDLELITASHDGETADETLVKRCRACGHRFSVSAKID